MTPVKSKKARTKAADKTAPKPGSFEHIEAQLHALGDKRGNTAKGDAFEELCCDYLLASYPQVKEAWLRDARPETQGADMGIDVFARTTSGELWAIQAKAYKAKYAIKKGDIDSFLAESSRSKYAFRLLIATTDGVGPNARHTLAGQEKGVGLVLRSDLANSKVKWPAKLGKPLKKLPRNKPDEHQKDAIKNVVKGFRKHDRGQLIMACGTGKTLTTLWINERLKSQRTLVLVPSLSLISQTFKEWNRDCKKPFDPLVVCSDQTVLKGGEDALIESTAELGVPVTTNLGEIRSFLRKPRERPSVVFCTYQSSDLIAEAQKSRAQVFDLVLADEAHRCAGAKAGLFATVLDAGKIKAKRRLFATATPRYFTPQVRKLAKNRNHELTSMDDQSQFGPIFHELNFAEAIKRRLLADYQVVVFGVTDQEARRLAEKAELVKTTDNVEIDARTLAAQIGLAKAIRKYDLKKVISFHSSVAKARTFSNENNEASFARRTAKMPRGVRPTGRFWTDHISGKTPTERRNSLIKHFSNLPSNMRGLLANCACLGEGVDVPVLDGVAFIAPKRSQIDIIQAVGRVIRKIRDAEEVKIGTIVIPLFIDDSEDADEALSDSVYEPVWRVICALRAHDKTLAEQLDKVRLNLGRLRKLKSGFRLPDKIHVDLPRNLPANFFRAFQVRTVETTTRRQFLPFEEARAFVRTLGLQGVEDWYLYLDVLPWGIYKGWTGYGDWLGTGNIANFNRVFMPFEEARAFVRALKLSNNIEWLRYCKGDLPGKPPKPDDIPTGPGRIYKDEGWEGVGDWLGTGRTRNFRPFKEARAFVRKLKLKGDAEWRRYCKGQLPDKPPLPNDIPSSPDKPYKNDGWAGMGDWLGTGTVATQKRNYLPFKKARAFARKLNLRNVPEWFEYCKNGLPGKPPKPDNISTTPEGTYKTKGWAGYGDWLGTGNIANFRRRFLPFKEARAFVHKLKLKRRTDWPKYCNGEIPGKPAKPDNIPFHPERTYKDEGWSSSGDWIGTDSISRRDRIFRPFKAARSFVRKLKLKGQAEWQRYYKGDLPDKPPKPDDIPTDPGRVYKNKGWAGYGDWLGTGTIATHERIYLSFKRARTFARKLKLRSQTEWFGYTKGQLPGKPPLPDNIPANPHQTYKAKGWAGYGDWLGTGTVATRNRVYMSYKKARSFVRKLKLSSHKEWRRYLKGEIPGKPAKPDNIPNAPEFAYKNKGWVGWGDWLGTGIIAAQKRNYLPFKKARAFARKLKLSSYSEWQRYCKGQLPDKPAKPENIPNYPDGVYKNEGWDGWGYWLGKAKRGR